MVCHRRAADAAPLAEAGKNTTILKGGRAKNEV
jgi:hypothetical protein